MKLRRKVDAPATEDRAELNERVASGGTPGQKLVGAIAAVLAVVMVLGGVWYKFIYQADGAAKAAMAAAAAAQAGKPQSDQTPPSAPSLNVPTLPMGGAGSYAGTSLPPGMEGGIATGPQTGSPAGQNNGSNNEAAALKAQIEAMKEQERIKEQARQQQEQDAILKRKLGGKMNEDIATPGLPRAAAGANASQGQEAGPITPAGATRLSGGGSAVGANDFSGRLIPTSTPKVSASYIPNPSFTVKKGTPIRCTMDTAMNSDDAGFVSCTVAKPVYGMDGRVVLVERGSTVDGELPKGPERGKKRAAVLWGRIVTPSDITIEVNSPGTDTLGASGLTGSIDNHYCERFCGAFLFSTLQDVIQGGMQALSNKSSGNTTVVLPQNSINSGQTAVGEMLMQGRNVQPTFSKNQGDEITITVARDLDFSTVYHLKETQQ